MLTPVTTRVGYTLQWVASEVGVSPETIRSWMKKGLLPHGRPCRGCRNGYSSEFLYAARCVRNWLDLYPRGPLDNLRDQLYPEPDEDEA